MKKYYIKGCINCDYAIEEEFFHVFCTYNNQKIPIDLCSFDKSNNEKDNIIRLIANTCEHFKITKTE